MSVDIVSAGRSLQIVDDIERRRCTLRTGDPVTPSPVSPTEFRFPVDVAASVRTSSVTLGEVVNTLVRTAEGEVLTSVDHFDHHQFEEGTYFIEFSAPVKLYVRVEGPVSVARDATEITVDLGDPRQVSVGARSYHDHPAATITTTERPVDVMRAVSHLTSALKTTTPDRSYPTLRGHPPEFALGERLDIPPDVAAPDSGLRIEVPPVLDAIYPVAPLSYYLGARVAPGMEPRIVADRFEYALGPGAPDRRFEDEVARVLKQTFFLDCLTRSEGSSGPVLYEREALSRTVDVPFSELYRMDAISRLEAYLDVPFEAVEPHLPQWKLTATVEPTPDNLEILPFFVDDLAVVRTPASDPVEEASRDVETVGSYLRNDAGAGSTLAGAARGTNDGRPSTIQPTETDSLEQAWVGERVPVGASKATVEAYRNRLARDAGDGDVDIVVVCNDEQMIPELESAGAVYGSREELPFDVTSYTGLTTDRLRLVLESDIDFLHYVGHIDEAGFQCTDGPLDVQELETVGVDAFFLNACSSYEQGMELIRRGAIGGVVTLSDVINSGALRVGETMARLLNRGFPLRPALSIASERSIVGSQYIVVGDGNFDLAHAKGLVPDLSEVESNGEGYTIRMQTFPTNHLGVGSIYRPEVADNEEYYLIGSREIAFDVSRGQLQQFLGLEIAPVLFDGEFTWSNEIDLDVQGPG